MLPEWVQISLAIIGGVGSLMGAYTLYAAQRDKKIQFKADLVEAERKKTADAVNADNEAKRLQIEVTRLVDERAKEALTDMRAEIGTLSAKLEATRDELDSAMKRMTRAETRADTLAEAFDAMQAGIERSGFTIPWTAKEIVAIEHARSMLRTEDD